MNNTLMEQNQMINVLQSIVSEASQSSNRMEEVAKMLLTLTVRQSEIEQKLDLVSEDKEKLAHRVNNLDGVNPDGTPRQRLVACIKKYAFDKGVAHNVAWHIFRQNYNTAYRANIEAKINNYCLKNNIKNKISVPEYLERVGGVEDALRIADKMLNGV